MEINKSLPLAQKMPQKSIPAEYQQVAEGMERQFAKQLIEEMRKTIDRNEEQSTGEKIYESLLDDEYADQLAQSGSGLGIKEMILKQIYPQAQQNKQDLAKYVKAKGP